jgi:DNA-binding HxlR family transcriptional regulator
MTISEFEQCAVNLTIGMIAGKWKPVILQHLAGGEIRFVALWRLLPRVSKKVLLEQLRQLEADGLVERREYLRFPPEVGYALTARGQSLIPVLRAIDQWAVANLGPVGTMPA